MIYELSLEEAEKYWDNLLQTLDINVNFYQSFSNGKIEGIINRQPRYLIYYSDNKIKAMAMCLFKKDLVTIPFGPALCDQVDDREFEYILDCFEKYLNNRLVYTIEKSEFEKYKNLVNDENLYWDFTTILLDTKNKNINDIISSFHTNRRRILRKCLEELKDYIIEDSKQNIDEFYNLYIYRLAETGCKIDFSEFYLKNIVENNNTGLLTCKNNEGKVISGLIYYKFGDTLITRHNAFDSYYTNLNPGTYLDFHMINRVVNDEVLNYYDFSGLAVGDDVETKLLNINRYKQSYGAKKILRHKWMYKERKL